MRSIVMTLCLVFTLGGSAYAFGPQDLCEVDDVAKISSENLNRVEAFLRDNPQMNDAIEKEFPFEAACGEETKTLRPIYRLISSFVNSETSFKHAQALNDIIFSVGAVGLPMMTEEQAQKERVQKAKSLQKGADLLQKLGPQKAANYLMVQELTLMFLNGCDAADLKAKWSRATCADKEIEGSFFSIVEKLRAKAGMETPRDEQYTHFLYYEDNFATP